MKKHIKFLTLIAAIGLFALAVTGCSSSKVSEESQSDNGQTSTPATQSSNKPKTVTIGFQAGAGDNVLVKAKGWFTEELAKQGIELKYVQFNAGRDINTAIASKSIDFGDLGDPPTSVGITRGLGYELFWIDNVIGDAEALAVKNNSKIKSLKDLKGKKIATTVGSTAHYSLLSALKGQGIEAQDVTVIDLSPPDIVAAWQRGDIDAAYTWQPNLGKLLKDGHVLISSKDLAGIGAPTANLSIVRSEFAEKYPEIVSLYVKQLIKAYDLYKNSPDEAAEAFAKELSIDKSEAAKQASQYIWLTADQELSSQYLGSSSNKGDYGKSLKKIADFLVAQKSLESAPEAAVFEKAVNPKYVEDALKK